jgi:hypothetical protein
MIKKYPDACEHLLNMGGAYQFKMDRDNGYLNLSRCLTECDKECPKIRNKHYTTVLCWSIMRTVRDRYIKEFMKRRNDA